MSASKSAEKVTRKRRGLLGMLYVLLVNLILMGVLAWFLLLLGFGIYRTNHSRQQTLSMIDAVVEPNINLLQNNAFGVAGYKRFQQLWQALSKGHSRADAAWLNLKLQQAQKQIPQLQHPLQRFWWTVRNEALPLLWGITCIVMTRMGILLLALPLFLLCLGLGLVDGLVQRDIRKFQGARESTLLFHEFKRGIGFWFFIPLFIYFLWPWPISAQWFLAPLAIAIGLLTQLGAKSFKKYV